MVGARWTLALLALAGCDQVLGVHGFQHPPPDSAFGAPCPAAAAGPDEDGDGCTDTLDNCPTFYNVDQLDTDGDLVGDACDPHPGRPGDSIVDEAYFTTAIDGGWAPTDPLGWTVANGVAVNAGVDERLGRTNMTSAGSFTTIELTYTAKIFVSHMSMIFITINDLNGGVVRCHVDYNNPTFDMFISNGISGGLSVHEAMQHVVFQIDAPGSHCGFVPQSIQTLTSLQSGPTTATIELINFKAELASIVVYQSVAP